MTRAPAVVVLELESPAEGGIQGYTRELIRALQLQGCSVEAGAIARRMVRRADGRRELRRWLRVLGRTGEVDFVILAHPRLLALLVSQLFSRSSARPHVLVCFYGWEVWGAPTWQSMMWRFLQRRTRYTALACSQFTAGALMGRGITSIVVHPIIPRTYFSSGAPQERPDRGAAVRILTVHRLNVAHTKGTAEILESVRLMKGEGLDVELTICGAGRLPSSLVRLAHQPWVSVESNVSRERLAKLYATHDIFVLATRTRGRPSPCGEGFGIVLVEAALAGLPVVVPASGGSGDAIIANLSGVRPFSEGVASLKASLKSLVEHPDLRSTLGSRGQRLAYERFDPERAAVELVSLLTELLRSTPSEHA